MALFLWFIMVDAATMSLPRATFWHYLVSTTLGPIVFAKKKKGKEIPLHFPIFTVLAF